MLRCKFKFLLVLLPILVFGQTPTKKEVNQQTQSWISLNNTLKLNDYYDNIIAIINRINKRPPFVLT